MHQKLYYALESLGLVEQLHMKVFQAIHVQRERLERPEAIADLMQANGVDRTRFLAAMNSFGVAMKVRQAATQTAGYKIEGTPSLGVNGTWVTTGTMAGSNEQSLAVATHLIDQARRGR